MEKGLWVLTSGRWTEAGVVWAVRFGRIGEWASVCGVLVDGLVGRRLAGSGTGRHGGVC